jgi:hypothetical protein
MCKEVILAILRYYSRTSISLEGRKDIQQQQKTGKWGGGGGWCVWNSAGLSSPYQEHQELYCDIWFIAINYANTLNYVFG